MKVTENKIDKRYYRGPHCGVIAIPLSMALAIASGVPPQHGLYTAIVAGIVIALTGGSRFNISGPTAAFVVILYPVTQQFGLSGLLMATLLSGIILVIMALSRLGRLIEYIPLPLHWALPRDWHYYRYIANQRFLRFRYCPNASLTILKSTDYFNRTFRRLAGQTALLV